MSFGGSGSFRVNSMPLTKYFNREASRILALKPLKDTEMLERVDLSITASGGGISAQAGAVRMGVARALVAYSEELRPTLRRGGHLTRDPRRVERKKPGLRKARKKPQYSKR